MDILAAIERLGPRATPAEIAGVTGKSRGAVKTALYRLKQQGVVTSEGGVYRLLRPVTSSKVTSGPTTPREDDMDWLLGDAVTDNPPPPWLHESTGGENEGHSVTGYSNCNRITAQAERVQGYDPVAAWSQGFEDGYGGPPDPAFARRQVRFLLASAGFPPETKAVSEKVSAELYLKGHEEGRKQAQAEAEEAERRRQQEAARRQAEEARRLERRQQEVMRNLVFYLAEGDEAAARTYLSRQPDIDRLDHDAWLAAAAKAIVRETVRSSLREVSRRLELQALEVILQGLR